MDFRRSRPSPGAMRWAEHALGQGYRVTAVRRMTGGIVSSVHRLTAERDGTRIFAVLRQFEDATPGAAVAIRSEADILRQLGGIAGLTAPELLACDPAGTDADGRPSLLMSRLPGHVDLTPAEPRPAAWPGRRDGRRHPRSSGQRCALQVLDRPGTAGRARVSQGSGAVAGRYPSAKRVAGRPARVLHPPRLPAFQPAVDARKAMRRGRLASACTGPPEVDIGHCRLNLAVLYSADRAERFRLAYEAEAGRRTDPWWDLLALASYSDAWPRFIPVQAGRRVPVDTGGMTARVEDLLRTALRRL